MKRADKICGAAALLQFAVGALVGAVTGSWPFGILVGFAVFGAVLLILDPQERQ